MYLDTRMRAELVVVDVVDEDMPGAPVVEKHPPVVAACASSGGSAPTFDAYLVVFDSLTRVACWPPSHS
jgi:hypothetical protein